MKGVDDNFKPQERHAMGESIAQSCFAFNGSIRVEARPERQTSDAGALLLREVMHKLGIIPWLKRRLVDPRERDAITHPLSELLRTKLLLLAQGWRDNDDADFLRHDPAFRLSASDRRGDSPLDPGPGRQEHPVTKNPPLPEGLASQPTLSRLVAQLAQKENLATLRDSLIAITARRFQAMRRGHRPRYVTIDIDSLPNKVHGHQPGSAYNGYYGYRMFHPLIASLGETGDLIGGMLRHGNVHTADGSTAFILSMVDQAERELCQVASVRMDAGFPEEALLAAIEKRGIGYVSRVKNNAVLDRLAEPFLKRLPGRPPVEPRMWLYELTYQAEPWSRARRVVLVVQEEPGELFLHHFWLITNWSAERVDGQALLALYRERGKAEAYMGEWMNLLEPALSSAPRPKRHYRQAKPAQSSLPCDSFAHNEVILLLNMLAYNLVHSLRLLMEKITRRGWSVSRTREQVLKAAGRLLVHGRYVTLVISGSVSRYWSKLLIWLSRLHPAEA
jgi:hypothetical protein